MILRKLTKSAILKAYSTSVLGIFSGLLTQFVFIKSLANQLSQTEFSLHAFVFQMVSYLVMLQLGLDYATAREISLNLGKQNFVKANYSYWFIRRLNYYLIGISLFAILLFLILAAGGWLFSEYNGISAAVYLIFLFGVSQVLQLYLTPNMAALIGTNKQYIVNLNNVVFTTSSTLLAYILLNAGLGIYSLSIALIILGLINVYFLRRLAKSQCRWIESKPFEIDKPFEKKTINYALGATLGGVAWTIEATSDVFLLNAAGLFKFVGVYILWWRFPQMLFDLVTRFATSSSPSFASTFGTEIGQNKLLFKKIFLIVSGGALVVLVGVSLWLPAFMKLWIKGKEYTLSNPFNVSFLIGSLVFLRILGNLFGVYLVAIGKVKITSRLAWIQMCIKLILAVWFIKNFELIGLFISSIVASFLQVICLGFYTIRLAVLSKRNVAWLSFTSAFIAAGINLLSIAQFEQSYLTFILNASITALVTGLFWILSIFLFGLNKQLGLKSMKAYVLPARLQR